MTNNLIKVRSLRTDQGDFSIFTFFLKGRDILRVADISRISRDDQGQLKGMQRKLIKKHIDAIVEYLDEENIIFPNSIILALDPIIEFKQSRGPLPDGVDNISDAGIIELPIKDEGFRNAWIVDGQQRSTALSISSNKEINVPVVGFHSPNVETQRQQFILVNKAKPLPRSLINELLPEIDSPMPSDITINKIPAELVDALSRTPGSPLFGLIKRPSNPEGTKAVITDTALQKSIKKSINDYGVLALYKGSGKTVSDVSSMYNIMVAFWGAVRETFPTAWGLPATESRLLHSAGISALGVLMDRMVPRFPKDKNLQSNITDALTKFADQCAWTEGQWDEIGLEWNEVQNLPRHIKLLADHLVQLDYSVVRSNQ